MTKSVNPFYLLLLAAGCAFTITACAYGVVTVMDLHDYRRFDPPTKSESSVDSSDSHGSHVQSSLTSLMNRHGTNLIVVELTMLAIGTVGAILYDQYLDQTTNNDQKKDNVP